MLVSKQVMHPVKMKIVSPEGYFRSNVQANLIYNASDPFLVTLSFILGNGSTIDWFISRDLLFEGASQKCGLGDVRFEPFVTSSIEMMKITLSNSEMTTSFHVESLKVLKFLIQTWDVVQPGKESDFLLIDNKIFNFLEEVKHEI